MTLPEEQAAVVGLGDIPPELVLQIITYMSLSDKYHLMVTCRGMHSIIQDLLYDEDIKSQDPCALRAACARGCIRLLETILDKGAPVDCSFSRYTRRKTSTPEDILYERDLASTPLTTAVACRQLEAVRVLLRRGAHPNCTVLKPESVNLFDGLPVKFQRPPPSFQTFKPIQWAANPCVGVPDAAQRMQREKLTEEIMRALISNRADINADTRNRGQWRTAPPLTLAIANKDVPPSIVRMLLDAGSRCLGDATDPTMGPFGYFILAELATGSENKWREKRKSLDAVDEEKIRLLLSRATPTDLQRMYQRDFTRLLTNPPTPALLQITRIYLSHTQVLTEPWRYDVDPPLAVAVRAFLDSVNTVEENRLFGDWSLGDVKDGYRDLFSLLLEFGAPLDPSKPQRHTLNADTALTTLCSSYCLNEDVREEFVKFFLSKGASPTGRDTRGYNPLSYAADGLLTGTAKLLLSKAPITAFWISPEERNTSRGRIATSFLYRACNSVGCYDTRGERTRADFAELMINCGATLSILDSHKCSPLAYACKHRDVDLVRCLLGYGANPNYDQPPQTPLQLAVGKYTANYFAGAFAPIANDEHVDKIVEMLLDYGAEVPMHWEPGHGINDAKQGGCPQRIIDRLLAKSQAHVNHVESPQGHKVD